MRSRLAEAHGRVAGAHRIGITGAPGTGKSTLTDKLVGAYRQLGKRVAVMAVDPTSPFSGGSLLGDRVRMGSHTADPHVFIRSMSTGGQLGGLNTSTEPVLVLLDAEMYDPIILETVGVGQSEVEVVASADTVVVVVTPGFGDEVQAEKAGLMEVADIFVVNKADLPGAGKASKTIEMMVSIGKERDWTPPILTVSAETGDGVDPLVSALDSHRSYLEASGELSRRRRRRATREIAGVVERALRRNLEYAVEEMADEVMSGESDPWTAAARLRMEILGEGDTDAHSDG